MFLSTEIIIILSALIAFAIVFSAIPTIVLVAHAKRLFDQPDDRSSHTVSTPTLGGIGIFASMLIVTGIFCNFKSHSELQYVFAAAVILFFVGIKDDILVIDPVKKLSGQFLATLILIILGDIRFTSLHGFLGINHLSYVVSAILTLFVFVVIINGFNLIDGIDGLASGVGIIASAVFGTWFLLAGESDYAIIAFALTGSLIAFFWYNVFGKKFKIFMGDTGSLILGLFMAVLAVRFNEMNIVDNTNWFIHSAPSVSFGILIVPLFDTMRVFTIRILRGSSPFKADKNHVHHKLLAMGFSHLKSSLFILGANLIVIIMVVWLNRWGIIDLMALIIGVAIILSLLPEIIYKITEKRKQLLKF